MFKSNASHPCRSYNFLHRLVACYIALSLLFLPTSYLFQNAAKNQAQASLPTGFAGPNPNHLLLRKMLNEDERMNLSHEPDSSTHCDMTPVLPPPPASGRKRKSSSPATRGGGANRRSPKSSLSQSNKLLSSLLAQPQQVKFNFFCKFFSLA